jgi:hypothetical protein
MHRLDALIERWRAESPCAAVDEIDPETSDYVLRAVIPAQPPHSHSLVVGDCVHNLRSALDHIVFQLSTNYSQPLTDAQVKHSEFPIFNRRSRFHERTKKGDPARASGFGKIEAVDPTAQAIIESMQPYRGGDYLWLMLLHELDRIDKHRRLILSAAASAEVSASSNLIPGFTFIPPGPVEDGDELLRMPFDPQKQATPKGTATFQVAFGPGQGPGERAWVLYSLRTIDRVIRTKLIPPLAPFL